MALSLCRTQLGGGAGGCDARQFSPRFAAIVHPGPARLLLVVVQDLAEEQLGALVPGIGEERLRLVLLDDLARSMKITRSATARAKPISWVTQSMVMPSRASSIMTSSTSFTISGSSADVGSSNSMILGRMHTPGRSPRAAAGRRKAGRDTSVPAPGCGPGEEAHGDLLGFLLRHLLHPDRRQGEVVEDGEVRKRLNDWKTMPTSRRIASMFFTSLDSVTPCTTMSPR